MMAARKIMALVDRMMALREVRIVTGRITCVISDMTCGGLAVSHATILKQLDGSVICSYY